MLMDAAASEISGIRGDVVDSICGLRQFLTGQNTPRLKWPSAHNCHTPLPGYMATQGGATSTSVENNIN